ncbi:hypothetical protein Droror1_Dr00005049 [Drosera rotundifolia]
MYENIEKFGSQYLVSSCMDSIVLIANAYIVMQVMAAFEAEIYTCKGVYLIAMKPFIKMKKKVWNLRMKTSSLLDFQLLLPLKSIALSNIGVMVRIASLSLPELHYCLGMSKVAMSYPCAFFFSPVSNSFFEP